MPTIDNWATEFNSYSLTFGICNNKTSAVVRGTWAWIHTSSLVVSGIADDLCSRFIVGNKAEDRPGLVHLWTAC